MLSLIKYLAAIVAMGVMLIYRAGHYGVKKDSGGRLIKGGINYQQGQRVFKINY